MEYMIKDNTIIFSPEFNKPFDSELLLNYKKIIFSNFTLNYSLYEAYENKNFKGEAFKEVTRGSYYFYIH